MVVCVAGYCGGSSWGRAYISLGCMAIIIATILSVILVTLLALLLAIGIGINIVIVVRH